jgi:hypothetical protein
MDIQRRIVVQRVGSIISLRRVSLDAVPFSVKEHEHDEVLVTIASRILKTMRIWVQDPGGLFCIVLYLIARSNKIMEKIGYMVNFIVAMMGVAFPLLLNMISDLSNKYGTMRIVDQFKKEPIYKYFFWSLLASVFFCVCWIFNIPPIKIGIIELIFSGSAERMLLLLGVLAISSFFGLVSRMLTYYDPIKTSRRLLLHETQANRKKSSGKTEESLKIVASIIVSYVKTGDEDIVSEIVKLFSMSIGDSVSNPVKSSEDKIYYDLSRKIFNATLARDDSVFEGLSKDILRNVWFQKHCIKDFDNQNLTQHTWYNLIEVINRDRISIFMDYWENADRRVRDYLYNHELSTNMLSDKNFDDLMLKWVNALQAASGCAKDGGYSSMEEFPEYLEAHIDLNNNKLLPLLKYVCYHANLGGLLLYLRKYEVIRRVFSYTSSWPPKIIYYRTLLQKSFVSS